MFRLTFIAVSLIIEVILAAPVNQPDAEHVAQNIFNERSSRTDFIIQNINIVSENDLDLYYIFHLQPVGFIIVAADDRVLPVLGYSFDNDFKSDSQPDHVNWFMSSFREQIKSQITSNAPQTVSVREKWNIYLASAVPQLRDRTVSPLLSARFDQGTTWNTMCPDDSNGPGDHALVGCVAVSMAQVMYYWKYPEYGTGSNSYYHSNYGNISANFNTFYDFENMQANVGNEASQKLLFHAGVAVDMGYGADGSGASVVGGNPSAYYAMKNHFQYRNNMDYVYSYEYSDSQFQQLLQDELDSNRPIIYRGYGNDGGHAWNIDGYQGDEFHCNWGWGGYNNGYFPLSTLGGFSADQAAIINIQPEDLTIPNVVLNSVTVSESFGDGDAVANPGEVINLVMEIENMVPWVDATGIELILDSQSEGIQVLNDSMYLDALASGSIISISNNPFVIQVSDDAYLGMHDLAVSVFAIGESSEVFHETYPLEVEVTLEQAGFPYLNSAIVESSPAVIDIDGDGLMEQFFGDYNGFIHGIDADGNSLNGFPIEIEGTSNQIWGSLAADDLDNDGVTELVVASKNKHVYVINPYGQIEMDFETPYYLMGTPALADVDGDDENEIIVAGFSSSGDVYVINYDGSVVNGFPAQINEKVLRGVATADLDDNGRADIVTATESDNQIIIIWDDGSFDIIFEAEDKFRSAPTIAMVNGAWVIFAGCENGHFYGVGLNGEIHFDILTGDNIRTSPAFMNTDNGLVIVFGSYDGYLFAMDSAGNMIPGWPIDTGAGISVAPTVTDIDGDLVPEIISGNTSGNLYAYHLDGSLVDLFPVPFMGGYSGTPAIADIDGDGDLEINIGTPIALSVVDVKLFSTGLPGWEMHRGNLYRNGYFNGTPLSITLGDMNQDELLNVLDIVMIINAILSETSTSEELAAGDMNQDGTLNVLDIVTLVNIILSEE